VRTVPSGDALTERAGNGSRERSDGGVNLPVEDKSSVEVSDTYERLAAKDPSTLSPPARLFVAVGDLRADVNNGGFNQYFVNSAGDLVLDVLQAAAILKAHHLRSLVEQALHILDVDDPSDRSARQVRLDDITDDVFDHLDDAYYALEESTKLDELMARLLTLRQDPTSM